MIWIVYFEAKEKNVVAWTDIAQRKHEFLGKIMEIPKTKKILSRRKIALELLHQRLGHRYARSLLDWYTANVWDDIELRIDLDPFFTACRISSMNKEARSKNPLNPNAPFKWVFMGIIPSTALITQHFLIIF